MGYRRMRFTPVATAVALVATACSSSLPAEDTVRAELGKSIEIRVSGSPTLATMWLDGIEPVECTEPGSLPPNKRHYLAATIVLQTTQEYEPDWGWWMTATDFTTVDDKGAITGQGAFTSCLPPHRYLLDDFYIADAGYYGVVLLDSDSEHGTLVYRPQNLPDSVPGWHWEY